MAFLTGMVRQVRAQSTVVSILPAEVTINEPGQTTTVDLNITDVTNLYGYEIKVWFENDIVNATEVVRPLGHLLEPSDPEKEFVPKWEIKNDYNATHGYIWLSYTLLAPESARSGSGILAKITFVGLEEGTTIVILNNYPGTSGPVKLANNEGQPIAHTANNGSVIVIPEFSIGMVLALLLAVSLMLIAASKMKIKSANFQKQL